MKIAYHFTGPTLRDGRPIPQIGEPLIHTGRVVICKSGFHASLTPWDAVQYAPGNLLHRVLCEDIADTQIDKLVCRRRTILATIDAQHLLRRFAADQALSVAHLWNMPGIVREYLEKLGPEKRAAARDAAWGAAWDAARAAARAAAWDDAAWDAAWAAAGDDFNARVYAAFGVTP